MEKHIIFNFYLLIFCGLDGIYLGSADVVEMRIVDEPTSYSWQQHNNQPRTNKLELRVNPSPFSGPGHLRRLLGKCFTKTINRYEYELCPFSNATQKEVGTNSWNPYRGVLGVWQEWGIIDNHFTSMIMLMGEQCGVNPRQIKVKLQCGKVNEILNVTEPRHCEYEMVFSTPLTCHNHSMLVYPTLSEELREKWDQLVGDLRHEDITDKGYQKALAELFKEAGYWKMSSHKSDSDTKVTYNQPEQEEANSSNRYTSLNTCNQAYESLQQELEQTKAQLQRFL